MKNILFIHNNFPAQFRHIAQLLGQKGHHLVFLTSHAQKGWDIPNLKLATYQVAGQKEKRFFGELQRIEQHAEAALRSCIQLKKQGFMPDVIYGASGWGGTWFMRDMFPDARLAGYFEWFYDADSADSRFGGSVPGLQNRASLRQRNMVIINDLLACDVCITPSQWQRDQFPQLLRERLTVLHDGIDTAFFCPSAHLSAIPGLAVPDGAPLVTYATRGMEPYRGFPQFMEAAAILLEKRADVHVAIAGEDRVCYGSPRPDGKTWKEVMLARLRLPEDRVHFLGSLPYLQYRDLLRRSNLHLYLTRPFVLSWSLLEAMSCACLVLASDTEPVRELIQNGLNGLLCDFFKPRLIANAMLEALDRLKELRPLKEEARRTLTSRYEVQHILPRLEKLLLDE